MSGTRFNTSNFNEYKIYMRQLSGDNRATRSLLLKNLRRAMDEELTPRQLQMVTLYYLQEKKMSEIADELGVHISTVSRTISRGKARLRKCLRYGAKELLRETLDTRR